MSRGRNDKTNKVAESKLVLDDEVLFTTFSFDLILAQKQPPEVLLEISQNSQENTCARVWMLNELLVCWTITKRVFVTWIKNNFLN